MEVGRVLSGACGYTFDAAVALAFIDSSIPADAQGFTVRSQGQHYAAEISRRPFYDPKGERMRG